MRTTRTESFLKPMRFLLVNRTACERTTPFDTKSPGCPSTWNLLTSRSLAEGLRTAAGTECRENAFLLRERVGSANAACATLQRWRSKPSVHAPDPLVVYCSRLRFLSVDAAAPSAASAPAVFSRQPSSSRALATAFASSWQLFAWRYSSFSHWSGSGREHENQIRHANRSLVQTCARSRSHPCLYNN